LTQFPMILESSDCQEIETLALGSKQLAQALGGF